MKRIKCSIIRGGTSKGVYMMDEDLPRDPDERKKTILKIFGSPDVRQIDGLGGADPLTSKFAVIGPSSRPDADVDYLFQQVPINSDKLPKSGICGNITSGVGPFAIMNGLVKPGEKETIVRIHNINTGKIIVAYVPMDNGEVAVDGDFSIAGVPGTSAKINIDFSDSVGAITGKMLPTGNVKDLLDVEGVGQITVSIVDAGNPVIFLRASELGLTAGESPAQVDSNPMLLKKLEAIRCAATIKTGLADTPEQVRLERAGVPMLAFLAEAQNYTNSNGKSIQASDMDFSSRLMFMQVMHKTYAGTASICTACAAKIPGTIVYELVQNAKEKNVIRFGHPGGVMSVEATAKYSGDTAHVTLLATPRTARLIMEGYVYIR